MKTYRFFPLLLNLKLSRFFFDDLRAHDSGVTHLWRCLKKFVKLKSRSVGWVFAVLFGYVEKNAFAIKEETKA